MTTSILRPIAAGMRSRITLRRRQLEAERKKGVWRLVGLAALGAGVVAVVVAFAVGAGLYVRFRGAEILASLMISGGFAGIMGALFLSSLGHAVQAFFGAKDLWFWDASCAPRLSLFVDRTVETLAAALPAVGSLGAIALGTLIVASGLDVMVLVRAELALAAVAMLPILLGVLLAHVGGALLPAGKLRRAALLGLTVVSAGGLLWLRAARVERYVTEDGAAELLKSAEGLSHVGPAWLPSSLGAHFAVDGSLIQGGLLLLMLAGLAASAFAAHRWLYARARDKAADDAPQGLSPTSRRRRALARMAKILAPERTRVVVERDLLVFVRDPAQWSQLILLLGIGLVYIINATALVEAFGGFGAASDVVLGTLHTGLVSFISAGLAARFAFGAVSAEGPAFWFVEGGPLTSADYLDAKWRGALPVVAGYPILVGLLGGAALKLSALSWGISVVLIVVTSVSVTAFAVGRGARAPVFDASNLGELAMGPGALSTMAWAVTMAGAVAGVFAMTLGGLVALQHFSAAGPEAYAILVVNLGIIWIVARAGRMALRGGAFALDQRRVEPPNA